jgi:hypothetical protein
MVLGIAAAIIVVACLAGVGFKLLGRHTTANTGNNASTGTSTSTGHNSAPTSQGATQPPVTTPRAPSSVVLGYFRAINQHHYRLAWRLGGKSIHGGYRMFRDGFTGTEHDTVQILSSSGDNVSARVTASQTDGTVKVFQGIYTVFNGAIVSSQVQRVG